MAQFKYNIGLEVENIALCIDAEDQNAADDQLDTAIRRRLPVDTVVNFWVNEVEEVTECQ